MSRALLAIDDQVVHFALYFVLGSALAHARGRTPSPIPHWILLLAGLLYGVTDELHQGLVPGRTPSLADLTADATGLAVGYLAYHALALPPRPRN
ncbi:MAG: VanZ family protein [Longimicrobiales bacterium]|nr:VanZ family protein [Longimicrobiales bacterium]